MRKFSKLLIVLFVVVAGIVYYSSQRAKPTTAQEPIIRPYTIENCFEAKSCEDDEDANCVVAWDASGKAQTTDEDHMAQLTLIKDPASNTYALKESHTTYILECFSIGIEEVCTTGNAVNDDLLFGEVTHHDPEKLPLNRIRAELDRTYGFDYNKEHSDDQEYGMYEVDLAGKSRIYKSNTSRDTNTGEYRSPLPLSSKSDKSLNAIQWKSYSNKGLDRKFKAYQIVTEVIPQGQGAPGDSGNVGGQQQADLPFPSPTKPSAIVPGCTAVHWDPEGRVFNAKTLEPIFEASLTLERKMNLSVNPVAKCGQGDACTNFEWRKVPSSPTLQNPQTTWYSGKFFFFTESDVYQRLQVQPPAGYTFPASLSDINSLHTTRDSQGVQMYYNLYTQLNKEIYQASKTVHTDVPLLPDPVNPPPPTELKVQLFPEIYPNGDWTLSGLVSHPLSTVQVYTKDNITGERKRLVGTYRVNADGQLSIRINQKAWAPEVLGDIVVTKFDYTGGAQARANSNTEVLGVLAQANGQPSSAPANSISLSVDPIPLYIEGYAFDEQGEIIPYAKVGVYLTYSQKPYYETNSHTDGSFRISSQYLPRTAYTIRFTKPDGTTNVVSTAKFLSEVAKQPALSDSVAYDPFTYTAPGRVAELNAQEKRVNGEPQQYFQGTVSIVTPAANNSNQGGQPVTDSGTQSAPNNIILIAVILLLLLGAVGVMLAVYIYKKNSAAQPPM